MNLSATVNGDTLKVLRASKLVRGMQNPRARADLVVEEFGAFLLDVSSLDVGFLGVQAHPNDSVAVVDLDDGSKVIMEGIVATRRTDFAGQAHDKPVEVQIDVLGQAWRLSRPPAYITAAFQAASQSDKSIIEAVLALASLDTTFDTSNVQVINAAVPPVQFENASPMDVIQEMALIAGAEWWVEPGYMLHYKLKSAMTGTAFDVRWPIGA